MSRLTILFQYGGRPYLEGITRGFLTESLNGFEDFDWRELDCSKLSIGKGFNQLAKDIDTEFVMYIQDDWAFMRQGNWVEDCFKILEQKHIGLIRLRKERDNQTENVVIRREFVGDLPYFVMGTWDNRGFILNPFMMRTEVLNKLTPLNEDDNGDIVEADGYEKFKALNLATAKLSIKFMGVCFHLGYTRSAYSDYKK